MTFVTDPTVKTSDETLLTQSVSYNDTVKLPYLYDIEKRKGAVIGFYLDAELTEKWNPETPVTQDLTIYPAWGEYYDSAYFNAPKMYLNTEGEAPIVSKETYLPCTVEITDAGAHSIEAKTAGVRGRGNTTWFQLSDKKAYRVKFDKKINLFGMGKEKDYLLIANAMDYTLMRNDLVCYTARALGLEYTTETEWIHLFLNGEYNGLYLLCEQTETGKYRVDIGKDDEEGNELKSGEEMGFLLEMDMAADHGGDRYFKFKRIRTTEGFRSWREKMICRVVSPDGDYITDEQFDYIKEYMTEVNFAFATRDFQKLSSIVDIDSLIDFYIVNQVSFSLDMGWAFYMYKPAGEKLHFGPVWDFDKSFGNMNDGGEEYDSFKAGEENLWFTWITESSQFKKAVAKRWNEVYSDIILKIDNRVYELYNKYIYDVKANFIRWDTIGDEYWRSPKSIEKLKTYNGQVRYLLDWLEDRVVWMNETISAWQ